MRTERATASRREARQETRRPKADPAVTPRDRQPPAVRGLHPITVRPQETRAAYRRINRLVRRRHLNLGAFRGQTPVVLSLRHPTPLRNIADHVFTAVGGTRPREAADRARTAGTHVGQRRRLTVAPQGRLLAPGKG